ncbi:unnamed protein product [Macrosiphum euphorbiae]|uniref:Uncharacterized protein n=1 Tax=Macrosiphum euphorbiae TaxID=13131 RepID=A0AAV0W6G2_9HEMI|nr:unnamed protein product [Macrosiphum euphorbiae]
MSSFVFSSDCCINLTRSVGDSATKTSSLFDRSVSTELTSPCSLSWTLLTAYTICSSLDVDPCNKTPDSATLLASVCTCVIGAVGSYIATTGSLHSILFSSSNDFCCSLSQVNTVFLPVSVVNGAASLA